MAVLQTFEDQKQCFAQIDSLKCAKSKVSVVSAENLSVGTRSRCFNVEDLPVVFENDYQNLLMKKDCKGYLKVAKSDVSIVDLFRCINIAPDIHSTNIHLEIVSSESINSKKLYLEITKDVEKGKELLLWFSQDLLAIFNMPFLTPVNITGYKKYYCHKCDEAFEYPNPLKTHLLLSCKIQSIETLWKHLISSIKASKITINRNNNLNIDTKSFTGLENTRSVSEPPISAFSPYKKQIQDAISSASLAQQPLNLSMSTLIHNLPEYHHNKWTNDMYDLKVSKSLEEISSNYAADVELFASNWGKLKQGHLCVYCGKIYSRKYGLKIHIRTHTGYKPLKCKFCLRPFGDPSNLNKHVRLHASGMTPYMCSLCGKVLVRRRDLERHLKSQHNEDGTYSTIKEPNSD